MSYLGGINLVISGFLRAEDPFVISSKDPELCITLLKIRKKLILGALFH